MPNQYPNSIICLANHEANTIMPWSMIAGMDTADLKAIYAYLKILEPIFKMVVHFSGQ